MYGATNIKADTYWLDTLPGMTTASAPRNGPLTVTGRWPGRSPGVSVAPRAINELWSGSIGRLRSGGSPSTRYGPGPMAAKAVIKRDVVPASRVGRVMGPAERLPALPITAPTKFPSRFETATGIPSRSRQSSIAAVSSPGATPVISLSPSASAAQINARLAMLFDGGTATSAITGPSARRTR